jgi:hypothetical protein
VNQTSCKNNFIGTYILIAFQRGNAHARKPPPLHCQQHHPKGKRNVELENERENSIRITTNAGQVEVAKKEFKAVYVTNAEIGLPDEKHQTRVTGCDMDPKTGAYWCKAREKGSARSIEIQEFRQKVRGPANQEWKPVALNVTNVEHNTIAIDTTQVVSLAHEEWLVEHLTNFRDTGDPPGAPKGGSQVGHNVVLYGPPGGGKTEAAMRAAKRAGYAFVLILSNDITPRTRPRRRRTFKKSLAH